MALQKLESASLLYYYIGEMRAFGQNPMLRGECSLLVGDCTKLYGDGSGLSGLCTGLHGDCTGIRGNLDKCEITDKERSEGVDIRSLVAIKE
jgi:hypothetical protein